MEKELSQIGMNPITLNKKTKIVATIGPASMPKEVLKEMILSGLNVCRLNFSHGGREIFVVKHLILSK